MCFFLFLYLYLYLYLASWIKWKNLFPKCLSVRGTEIVIKKTRHVKIIRTPVSE